MGGGGQQRWQQSGGWWDFQGAAQCRFRCRQDVRRSRLVQRIDVSGTGLDWEWSGTGDSRAARGLGDHGQRARRDGDKIGGTLYGKVEGDAVQLRNVGAPKKAMGWGRPSPKPMRGWPMIAQSNIRMPGRGTKLAGWLAGWLTRRKWVGWSAFAAQLFCRISSQPCEEGLVFG